MAWASFYWYNLRDLSLLRPRFISTVDSGNLFACLITTACALAECAGQAEKTSAEFAEELEKACGALHSDRKGNGF